MTVLDAGVVVSLLVGDVDPALLPEDELSVPHLLDSEVLSALRHLLLRGRLAEGQAEAAVAGFSALHLVRHPAEPLRHRMWELRRNLSAYDATYVALAESLGGEELLTTDARLARAPGVRCPVTVV